MFKYYGELRYIDGQLREKSLLENRIQYLDKLNEIEDKVSALKLPVTFSQYAYELRAHIELVRTRLQKVEQTKDRDSAA